jgi:hypothetical protein
MKMLELVRVTSGGHHGWYRTDLGTVVRKPLGQRLFQQMTFWRRIKVFFIRMIRFVTGFIYENPELLKDAS